MHESSPSNGRRLGVWLIGARGAISTCLVYGVSGLRQGRLEPTGIATSGGPFAGLSFAGFDELHLGGHDVVRASTTAADLVRHGILPHDLVAAGAADAASVEARIRPGVLDGPDVGHAELDPESSRLGAASQREQIASIARDLAEFRSALELDRVVVVCLSSTEAWRAGRPCWDRLDDLEEELDADRADLPASSLYAYAALLSGAPFINFTPNRGAEPPALRQLARRAGLPHCGSDGKTGETLLKTALAPMFPIRALTVEGWYGTNILGNTDGLVLADPENKASKITSKKGVLEGILGYAPEGDVRIDYFKPLADHKVAWNFIQFRGWGGHRMRMQFTWEGTDSVLAAPLVIDIARLALLAQRRGESGPIGALGLFFKTPEGSSEMNLFKQYDALLRWAGGGPAAA